MACETSKDPEYYFILNLGSKKFFLHSKPFACPAQDVGKSNRTDP